MVNCIAAYLLAAGRPNRIMTTLPADILYNLDWEENVQLLPGTRCFSRSKLFRISRFCETYRYYSIVAPEVRQLPGSKIVSPAVRQLPEKVSPLVTQLPPAAQTRLPDKKLLQAKLHEFYALANPEGRGK